MTVSGPICHVTPCWAREEGLLGGLLGAGESAKKRSASRSPSSSSDSKGASRNVRDGLGVMRPKYHGDSQGLAGLELPLFATSRLLPGWMLLERGVGPSCCREEMLPACHVAAEPGCRDGVVEVSTSGP